MAATAGPWSVVVPVKRLALAKSRLALDLDLRRAIALAMAQDTVRAALLAAAVVEVVVVTDDESAAAATAALGAVVVADRPDAGLNPALEHGAGLTRTGRVAALSSDLPALTPEALTRLLDQASLHRRAVVADVDGTGTTVLTARTAAEFAPRFGAGSFAAHLATGAVDLTAHAGVGVRLDVDTVAALHRAAALGVGPATRSVLEGPARVTAE